MTMNVLLIGSGGREHALAWRLSESPLLSKLYCAPGNGGIAQYATCVALDVENHAAVIEFCRARTIGFVVIGPEAPLVAGLGDALGAAGIKHFGPSKAAAQLEGSKGFTKDLCREFNIPTGAYGRFSDKAAAKAYLAQQAGRVVVKADGLAAGKGVIIPETRAEAEAGIDACFDGAFGAAGAEVVIEAFLDGEEASFFALSDGVDVIAFGAAQDHKRVGDGDTGPEHGRHGCLFAGAGDVGRDDRADDGRDHPADGGRDGEARHAVQRRVVCGSDDRRGWAEADRIQHAVRRSGMSGADDAAKVRSAAGADGGGGRHAWRSCGSTGRTRWR